ncbi:MAG: glycosyltransferase family 4 protein [Ruminococcaceae bacterium]|nr:glycosyltransferase family 4 protein [Oscillospiraceae bacterium]
MNVLFISISSLSHLSQHSISLDLLREFKKNGHNIYAVCSVERKQNTDTYVSEEAGCKVLRVKTGNNKQANIIEKGITNLLLPYMYISAIKKYFPKVKFDLVLYPTPPVTHVNTVSFIKRRDNAKAYLLLKDIFPQNAVDIGMMSKTGIKGLIYKYFRHKEKKLYEMSDYIGCMSQANCDYLLEHNPRIQADKVEICPNSIEIQDMTVTDEERDAIRNKYEIPLDKKVFVYGGNLGRPQGIPFIIDCLKKLETNTDAYFLVVGDGTEFKKLEAYFENAKPMNMKLMKRIPKEDYDKMIAACDWGLIFLDHRFTIPNFPSRLLSYMQAGLPVISATDPSTDVGKTIEENGFGFMCESNDADAFVSCIEKALMADTSEMKRKGFEFLNQNYTVERAYNTIIKRITE